MNLSSVASISCDATATTVQLLDLDFFNLVEADVVARSVIKLGGRRRLVPRDLLCVLKEASVG